MTVIIKKIGGSVGVVIPRAVAREMDLAEGDALHLSATGSALVMRKQHPRPRRPLVEIVRQIKPASYRRRRRELGEDAPVGRETW